MELRHAIPRHPVRSVVRSFAERRVTLGAAVLTKPLPARPNQFIEIYLAEPYGVRIGDGPLDTAPEVVVVGPQSRRCTQLFLSGDIHVFTILLQPAGLHRLTGTDLNALVNQGVAATEVVGSRASVLRDGVLSAADFPGRVAAAERWVAKLLDDAAPADAIDHASRLLVATRGRARIDALVARSGLSPRQFQRRFTEQVGLSPKLYARAVRFDAALAAHRSAPTRRWTEIVHEAGYFDQAHFIRECHALADAPPGSFITEWESIFSMRP